MVAVFHLIFYFGYYWHFSGFYLALPNNRPYCKGQEVNMAFYYVPKNVISTVPSGTIMYDNHLPLRKSKTKIWFNIWPVQTPTWTIGPHCYFRSLRISVNSEPLFNNPPHVYFPLFPLVNIWRFTVLLVAVQENLTFPWLKWLLIYELEKSPLWQFKSKFWPPDPEFYFYFI